MKKIFAYIGSGAGEKSHTYKYINNIIKEVVNKSNLKISYEVFTPFNSNINSCKSCNSCFYTLSCTEDKNDDMYKLKQKMLESDLIIFGSPIYSHHISSDMKKIIDRSTYWCHLMILAGKTGMAITTNHSNGHLTGIEYLSKIMTYMGLKVIVKDNVALSLPNEFYNTEVLNERIDYFSDIAINYLNGNRKISSSDELEEYFNGIKSLMLAKKETKDEEYNFWFKNGFLECNSFKELLLKVKYEES